MAITGRSVHTIYRWKREQGIDVADRAELLAFAQSQDARARGNAFQNVRRRRLEALEAAQEASELRSRFAGVDPEEFVLLPAPYTLESADRVMALIREIEVGFLKRVEDLKKIGPTLNLSLAEEDLEHVRAAYRTLDNIFEGFQD